MSGSMEQAFSSIKTKSSADKSSAKPMGSAPRLTLEDIRARRMARMMGKADATVVIDENVVTDYVNIADELRAKMRELEPLMKKHSTIPVEQLNRERSRLEAEVSQCQEELQALATEFPGIVAKVAQREELRSSARADIRAIAQIDPTYFDRNSVNEMLAAAVATGTLKVGGDSYVAAVEDPVLQELEGRVSDFFKEAKAAREEEQRERSANVADYLLGDQPKGQSPLDAEKHLPGRVSLTCLREGEGERAFVPVFGTKRDDSGEEYFMGEVVLERVAGKVMVVKASRVRLCEILFFAYDRTKETHREKGAFALPSDLTKVQPNLLREALQRQLGKDAESSNRREKADLLSAVESYSDAVTFNDFRFGDKSSRWIVDADWTPAGKQRHSHVTFHVVSDGKQFRIADAACNLEEVDATFFGMYMKPSPISALSSDKRWLALAANNRQFECGWEVRREAAKLSGVTFVTAENVSDLFGETGVDGVYAAVARWQQQTREQSDAPKYVTIGYLVERRGEKVAITYTTSGTATTLVEKERDAYPVSDLPIMTRAIARAIWMAVKRDFGTVPEHIKAVAANRK